MADDDDAESVVFQAHAANLTDAQLSELKDKFGLEVRTRSTKKLVDTALGRIGDVAVVFFDKSSPGFDKVFDKTSPGNEQVDVINPVDLATRIQAIEGRLGQQGQQ